MPDWLDTRDSLDDMASVLTVFLAIATIIGAMWRFTALRPWRWVRFLLGGLERSYAIRFEQKCGVYENLYLQRAENRELRHTYIPLNLERAGSEARPAAADVLRNRQLRSIVVVGVPGAGKSTMLRAYGIESLRTVRARGGRPIEIPFLVQLRKYAAAVERNGVGLADYVQQSVLVSAFGMTREDAERLFVRALREDRAVVLLDGLDEVPQERHDALLHAVVDFREDLDRERPTGRARLVLTCRQQNFTSLRDKWEPVMKLSVYPSLRSRDAESYELVTIAPLTDAEIDSYLRKVRTEFRDAEHGPRMFLSAVRASGTLDLHRVPMVLAMSVGVYADKVAFDIPSELARLYKTMVGEMLIRHAFRDYPGAARLAYLDSDKSQFLREFATANANGETGFGEKFGEFSRAAMYRRAQKLAGALRSVTEADAEKFVDEILDHSGLVTKAGDEDACAFAHKSIQEYFVAEQLRTLGEAGARQLLEHAAEPQWRQVFSFYVSTDALSREAVDAFMTELARRDVALAGSCLAGANCSPALIDAILRELAGRVDADERVLRRDETYGPAGSSPQERSAAEQRILVNLAALLDAAQSVQLNVRTVAGEHASAVLGKIIDLGAVFELLGADLDNVVRVLDALARRGSPGEIATVAPKVSDAAPVDSRLIGPLWRCLAVPGMEQAPGTERIVERLLTLATDPACFKELLAQEPHAPEFAMPEARRAAYPFARGLSLDSNLVTLLSWADRLHVEPALPNRFFEARRDDPRRFQRAEADHRRSPRVSLFWLARVLSAAGMVLAFTAAVVWLTADRELITGPHRAVVLWWLVAPTVAAPLAFAAVVRWASGRPAASFAQRYLTAGAAPDTGNSGHLVAEALSRLLPNTLAQLVFLASSLVYALALAPLLAVSTPAYLGLAAAAACLLGWLPFLAVFNRGERLYLYRPNPYDDMYDDPRTRHWITPDALAVSAGQPSF